MKLIPKEPVQRKSKAGYHVNAKERITEQDIINMNEYKERLKMHIFYTNQTYTLSYETRLLTYRLLEEITRINGWISNAIINMSNEQITVHESHAVKNTLSLYTK